MISILIRRGYGFDVMAKALFQAPGEPLGDRGRTSVNANAHANCNANAHANCNANADANCNANGKAKAKANYSVILAIEP
jgi:hypothetical protein